jgi:hypothetical protein
VRTGEENSTNWVQIGEVYQSETLSIRALAKRFGISDTAVRKEAKKRGWSRPEGAQAAREPDCKPAREPRQRPAEAQAKSIAAASVKDLTGRGRNIILALMAELEFLNANHETLAGLVEDYVNGDKEAGVKAKLLKALDHETRSKTANYLATALAKLNDAAPGKKEQAQADAETAGQGSGWGDDLEPGMVGRPN